MQKKYKILSEGEVGHGILIEQDAGETIKINEKNKILKENEDSNNNGIQRILIDCILQKANVKNRNGRIYPKEVLVREVEKYKALIEANNSYGECDHPDTPTISLKHDVLSHLVRSVRWDGDTLYGTIEIITSKGYHNNGGIYCIGDHIANLLERGYKLGISSRGLGSLKNIKGQNYVQNDFELLGWDLVSSPSTPDAYLFQQSKTISESYNNSEILNENQKKLLNFLDFSKKML